MKKNIIILLLAVFIQCGCHVTVTGKAQIAEMGVCWNTAANPVATGNHLSTTATGEPFNCTLTELVPETEYHVRAYALYESEYYYGQELGVFGVTYLTIHYPIKCN